MYGNYGVFAALLAIALGGCKEEIVPPVAPANGSINVIISWSDPRVGATKVKLVLEPGGQVFTSTDLDGTVRFADLEPGIYSVSAKALDANSNLTHEGSTSGVAVVGGQEATTRIVLSVLPPDIPGGLTASTSIATSVLLRWQASARATGYRIYRASSYAGTYSLLDNVNDRFYFDSQAGIANRYHYKVSATIGTKESQQSAPVAGFRTGWKFYNVSKKVFSDGVGFTYDLRAFGYPGATRAVSLYAVSLDNGLYKYVPGSGSFGYAAYIYPYTPTSSEQTWGHQWDLLTNVWNPGYRNNNRPQYIAMKVYSKSAISMLNDSFIEWSGYYRIQWVGGSPECPMVIGRLSAEESARIDEALEIGRMGPAAAKVGIAPQSR